MTNQQQDTRVIEAEHESYNATIVRREDDTLDLARFWVRLDNDPVPFEPGQYMTIGVFADGKLLQRPYSVASSPRQAADGYEMYVRLVDVMRFTSALWRLPVGQRVRMIGPKGRFMLEPNDARTHLFISTGTGIAPFISMMRTMLIDGAPRRVVMLNGASFAHELSYVALLEQWQVTGEFPVTYVPTVSRPDDPRNSGWTGHTGRVEQVVLEVCQELSLDPIETVVYICGNPDMIVNVETLLMNAGFPEFHVKKELYWPKGKTVPGADAAPGASGAATTV